MKKICIFGGAFNPVHKGHIKLVEKVYDYFLLDKLIIMPSKNPPHKSSLIVPEHRLKMLEYAFKDIKKNVEVSDFEIKSKGISYTYKTLDHFRNIYPDDSISFLTGSDIFATITTWKKWEYLFKLANFIVVSRKEVPFQELMNILPDTLKEKTVNNNNIREKYGKIYLYEMPFVEISSTEIRENLKNNKCSEFLPDIIYNYIKENKLYLEV